MWSLITKDLYELFHKKTALLWNLLISFATGGVINFITEDDTYNYFYSAQSVLFALSCAIIILGVIAACQDICSDYDIINREVEKGVSALKITISRCIKFAILNLLMCACVIIPFVFFNKTLKNTLLPNIFIVSFLVMFATSLCGLIISTYANNQYVASNIVPIFILLQIVFSGRFFNFESLILKGISTVSLSRWLLDAYLKITSAENIYLAIKIPGVNFQTENLDLPPVYSLSRFFIVIPVFIILLFIFLYFRLSDVKNRSAGKEQKNILKRFKILKK